MCEHYIMKFENGLLWMEISSVLVSTNPVLFKVPYPYHSSFPCLILLTNGRKVIYNVILHYKPFLDLYPLPPNFLKSPDLILYLHGPLTVSCPTPQLLSCPEKHDLVVDLPPPLSFWLSLCC